MADFTKAAENLRARGFQVTICAMASEAASYIDGQVDGVSVGIGGSMTVQELGLYDLLRSHNQVHWHWTDGPDARPAAMQTEVYLTSVNGLAETGELVNIDGVGNRVAGTLFGHRKVYFIVGRNKLASTYDDALWRARNVAAPKNAQRMQLKTPCAVKGDRCYDCRSPERICRGLVVLWRPMMGMEAEIVLVDEDLGY